MAGLSRLIAAALVTPALLALIGCAATPGTPTATTDLPQPPAGASGAAVEVLATIGVASANPPNFVELRAAESRIWTDGGIPRYSNTYIYETLDDPPTGPFVTAAYYDGGGYPIYYPYPYTIGSQPRGYPWYGAYGSSSQRVRSSGSAARGTVAGAVNAKVGRSGTAAKARARGNARASGARSTAGRVHPAAAASAQRRAASGERRPSAASARQDEWRPSAGYAAARARSSGYRSGASHSRLYSRERKGNLRARPSGVTRGYSSGRARSGARGTRKWR